MLEVVTSWPWYGQVYAFITLVVIIAAVINIIDPIRDNDAPWMKPEEERKFWVKALLCAPIWPLALAYVLVMIAIIIARKVS